MGTIDSYGAYTPRYRIDASEFVEAWGSFDARGVSSKAVPSADEDAVTMAVEAVEEALEESEYGREEVDSLVLGTTTPPLDEGDVAAQVAEIVGLKRDIEVTVHSQSTRDGVRALVTATRSPGVSVAVAADCPVGAPDDSVEHAAGAGAVAFVVS
ncbi:MAG: ACP synthase, partial [Halobacteria archaeon]|nr:ACP synthase [Halobacteria archaeon]